MSNRIQLRRDLEAVWAVVNPTLAQGEIGIETDTKKMKLGDGLTSWNSLQYMLNIPDSINNADLEDAQDGAVLVYDAATQKFVATSLLTGVSIDGGSF